MFSGFLDVLLRRKFALFTRFVVGPISCSVTDEWTGNSKDEEPIMESPSYYLKLGVFRIVSTFLSEKIF